MGIPWVELRDLILPAAGLRRIKREDCSSEGSNSRVSDPLAAASVSRAGSPGADQARSSARRASAARSWTTSSRSGCWPGGSPVAVRASISPMSARMTSTARGTTTRARSVPSAARDLEPQAAECAQLAAVHRLSQRVHTGMKPEGQVGHDDRPGLGPAEGDLVIRFGVGTRRVQADDGQAFGRGPAEIFSALIDRPAHDRRVDAGAGQRVVEIGRGRDACNADSENPGKAATSRCSLTAPAASPPRHAPRLRCRESRRSLSRDRSLSFLVYHRHAGSRRVFGLAAGRIDRPSTRGDNTRFCVSLHQGRSGRSDRAAGSSSGAKCR